MKRIVALIFLSCSFILVSYSQSFKYETRQLNEVYLFGLDEENSKYGEIEQRRVSVEFSFSDKIAIKATEVKNLPLWNIDNIYSMDITMYKNGDIDGENLNIGIYTSQESEEEENPDFMIIVSPYNFDFKFEPGDDGDLLTKCTNYVLGFNKTPDEKLLEKNKKAYSRLIEELNTYRGKTKVSKIKVR